MKTYYELIAEKVKKLLLMVCVIEDKTLDKNKLINKILVCILLAIFCSPMIGYAKTENDNGINQHNSSVINEEVLPDHLVIRKDHVLSDLLSKLGAQTIEKDAPFKPLGGAYGYGRTHAHSH